MAAAIQPVKLLTNVEGEGASKPQEKFTSKFS